MVASVAVMLTWNDVIRLADTGNVTPPRRVDKTDDEWKAELDPTAYQVTRHAGTERPFSSDMCSRFEPGMYGCVCCGTPLFDGSVKFESGTGWPSFTEPLTGDVIAYHVDRSHGMVRVETECNVCDAHLGHVFPDGPPPTGLRFCMNAAALRKLDDAH
jgi:methionine-R-sulfoxide reductase